MSLGCSQCYLLVNCELSTLRPWPPRLLRPHSALYSACAAPLLFLFLLLSDSVMSLCDAMNCSTPGLPVHHHSQSLLKLMSIELVMPSNHLTLCRPLLLLPSIFPSIRVFFQWVTSLHQAWSISFSISPSNEYSGLISFRIDWIGLLAVQGTLKSLLQHQSLKASILRHSAFMVQFSHPYMTTGKIIALTIWTFVGKVTYLLF